MTGKFESYLIRPKILGETMEVGEISDLYDPPPAVSTAAMCTVHKQAPDGMAVKVYGFLNSYVDAGLAWQR